MDNYFKLYKYTGIAGLKTELKNQIVGLKSIDRAVNDDYQDALRYPAYAPYDSPVSYSCESWIKIEVSGNSIFNTFANLSVDVSCQVSDSWSLFAGIADEYVRPTNAKSSVATMKGPCQLNAFNGISSYPVTSDDGVLSNYIVLQLAVYSPSQTQPVSAPINLLCDKYCIKTSVINVYTDGANGVTPLAPKVSDVMLKSSVDVLDYDQNHQAYVRQRSQAPRGRNS